MRPLQLRHGERSAKGGSASQWHYLSHKSVQLLVYAGDSDIIGRTKRDVTAAFGAIEPESTKMGLAVNEGKTKYMFLTSRDVRRIDSRITGDNYTFNTVKEFICLGSAVTTKNDVCLEIKRRITLANRCYYGLNGQLSNRDLSRTTKLILYKTLILPVLLYGAEAWTLLSTDAAALRVFERKVLSKIFGPVRVGDDFRIRFNSELELCSVLISSGCAGSSMSFVWRSMLRRDGYLMWGSAEIGEEDDLASIGNTKLSKPCHRLV